MSLKLSVVAADGRVEVIESLAAPLDVDAVGHRIVHGGSRFREPVLVDDAVARELEALTELAPLHNAPALSALASARRALPDVPHVAVFDTAFHATIPAEASTYPLPRRLREQFGLRRYGFHGLSVQWSAEHVPAPRLVVCHLGGGCSVTAVRDGQSIDTTMGFTPLEGVPMATRPGSVDPGILLHVLRHGVGLSELGAALEHESGLLGLSGTSGDVMSLELELDRDPGSLAHLALEIYTYRIAGAVATMAVPLGGVDALVFTAGVGENSAFVRKRVCERLGFLGVELDPAANGRGATEGDVQLESSRVRVVVVRAREDVVAARAIRAFLAPTR